jgi:hypothetical protein
MYDRSDAEDAHIVGEWDDAVSWIAHPDEEGKRGSHAIATDNGVWVIDPINAPNVDEILNSLGEVVGVTVLTCWHARDAGAVADRHDVKVHIPEWMDRVDDLVDAPVQRYTLAPDENAGKAEFYALSCRPFPGWQEVFLYHDPSETLVTPDSMGTTDWARIGDERLGLSMFRRLQPPTQLTGLKPERILVGHGEPLDEDAASALQSALSGARRSFPRAVLSNGSKSLRAGLGAVRD